jgi:hypothetical protein
LLRLLLRRIDNWNWLHLIFILFAISIIRILRFSASFFWSRIIAYLIFLDFLGCWRIIFYFLDYLWIIFYFLNYWLITFNFLDCLLIIFHFLDYWLINFHLLDYLMIIFYLLDYWMIIFYFLYNWMIIFYFLDRLIIIFSFFLWFWNGFLFYCIGFNILLQKLFSIFIKRYQHIINIFFVFLKSLCKLLHYLWILSNLSLLQCLLL